jgi:hypothetical protein
MTSSEARRPRKSRRFLWLTIFIVVLFGGYSAGWFYVADRVKAEVVARLATMNRGEVSVECDNPQVGGFPFRIGVSCDRLAYADGARRIEASAGSFRSLAQVYQPNRALAELDGPLHVSAPGLGAIRLDWDRLRASVRIARPLPERVSVEAEGLKGTSGDERGAPAQVEARTSPPATVQPTSVVQWPMPLFRTRLPPVPGRKTRQGLRGFPCGSEPSIRPRQGHARLHSARSGRWTDASGYPGPPGAASRSVVTASRHRAVCAHAEFQRRAGVKMPDLDGIAHAVPGRDVTRLEQEIDRRGMAARAAGLVAERLDVPAAFRDGAACRGRR